MTSIDLPVPEPFNVIAAFLDGEHVDGAVLKQALSSDEGRAYLIDVLALRQSAAGKGPLSFPSATAQRRPALTRWVGAAAIALVASGIGFLAGGRIAAVGGAAAPPTVEAVIDLSAPAPEPTQTIRLLPGESWNVSRGN